MAATYSPRTKSSTIGHEGLNFSPVFRTFIKKVQKSSESLCGRALIFYFGCPSRIFGHVCTAEAQ